MKHTLFTYLLAAGCCLPMLQANAKVGDILPIPHIVNTPTHAKPFMLNREVALIGDIPCVALQRFLTTNGCKLNASAIAQIRVQKVESIVQHRLRVRDIALGCNIALYSESYFRLG